VKNAGFFECAVYAFLLACLLMQGCAVEYKQVPYTVEIPQYGKKKMKVGKAPVYGEVPVEPVRAVPGSKVAVFPLRNLADKSTAGDIIAEELEYFFTNNSYTSERYSVVVRSQLNDIFSERTLRGEPTPHVLKKGRSILSLDTILHGTVLRGGGTWEFILKCSDTRTGELVWSTRGTGGSIPDAVGSITSEFLPSKKRVVYHYKPVYETRRVKLKSKFITKYERVPTPESIKKSQVGVLLTGGLLLAGLVGLVLVAAN